MFRRPINKVKPRVLIDCDPGIDDAIALVTAAKYTEILGITTVAGNVSLESTTRNTLALCELLGLDVPVHAGAAHSLRGQVVTAEEVHGDAGLGTLTLPTPKKNIASDDAATYIIESFTHHKNLHLVALGPLTNIAKAIEREPNIVNQITDLTIMGGSARGIGNVTAAAEFNIFADPEAASVVFSSGVRLKMIGLNLTHQVQMGLSESKRLTRHNSVISRTVAELLLSYQSLIYSGNLAKTVPMHDPCAILAVSHPEFFTLSDRNVNVETAGTYTRGLTLVDERRVPAEPNCRVGYEANSRQLIKLILNASMT
ncbi:MAG TPA: hypothetical protein EYQ00_04895 [Dehalococcoidia bacterium]|jgi:inosine-uridine nucleoside N-ribohydrolase|nr:hypothetical protein [Dehalococcoidia bacterium]